MNSPLYSQPLITRWPGNPQQTKPPPQSNHTTANIGTVKFRHRLQFAAPQHIPSPLPQSTDAESETTLYTSSLQFRRRPDRRSIPGFHPIRQHKSASCGLLVIVTGRVREDMSTFRASKQNVWRVTVQNLPVIEFNAGQR
jgi:hypothetical protein